MEEAVLEVLTDDNVNNYKKKKMKILCLHGFRTSGSFLKKQISKWDPSIFPDDQFELVFPDGIFPAGGKSEIEGVFPPPYFEWFQFNQGAALSGLLLGYQAQGKVLKDHPAIKLFVSVSGSKFRDPSIGEVAYKEPIKAKSVHFIGAKDWLQLPSEDLAAAFDKPLILRHPQGHTVPRLDEVTTSQLRDWTMNIVQSDTGLAGNSSEPNNRDIPGDVMKPVEAQP
ncbi:uncharacterized protein LOC113287453 isoform X2 [Papaver somniferum]|uniref:uncharacterized protein LOC113287453 isoform X2 n=1 Tax=Papaver somniferum TaxID=3469 RepID=UPI000E700DD9|nr:uncharacterized protein LOC113287453 isoform X2 [Papaver somniferum]